MSLVPKLDELRILTSTQSFDLGFITETWLRESVCDAHASLVDYIEILDIECVLGHESCREFFSYLPL